jgi:hypothetical protein
MEEIKRAIRALPFVTKLSPVRTHNGHGDGWGVSLRCFSCEEYDSCGKKQESPVQISSRHPMELACLQELLKRLQDRHGQCVQAVAKTEKVATDAPNVMQAMMLFQQAKNRAKATQDRAKAAQDEAKVAKKVALQSPEHFEKWYAEVKQVRFWAWLEETDNATHFKSKENLLFWSERPSKYKEKEFDTRSY